MRFESVIMLCGGREAISYDVLEQADEQRSFPAVHFIMCIYTKEEEKRNTEISQRRRTIDTLPFQQFIILCLFSELPFQYKICIGMHIHIHRRRMNKGAMSQNLIYWFLNIWLSLYTKGTLYWIILLIITNDEIFSANNSSALIMSFLLSWKIS